MKSQTIKYRGLLYWHRRCQLKLQTNNSSWYDCLLLSVLLLLVISFSIYSSSLLCKVTNAQPITPKDMGSYERISQDVKAYGLQTHRHYCQHNYFCNRPILMYYLILARYEAYYGFWR